MISVARKSAVRTRSIKNIDKRDKPIEKTV